MDDGKLTDRLLDKISELKTERDQARIELSKERVARRLVEKQLREVTGMVLQ